MSSQLRNLRYPKCVFVIIDQRDEKNMFLSNISEILYDVATDGQNYHIHRVATKKSTEFEKKKNLCFH